MTDLLKEVLDPLYLPYSRITLFNALLTIHLPENRQKKIAGETDAKEQLQTAEHTTNRPSKPIIYQSNHKTASGNLKSFPTRRGAKDENV